MPSWAEKTLKYNPEEKSLKAIIATYLDLECLLKKEQSCQNNPEKSYTGTKAIQEPSGWAMFIRRSFDKKEKDCIEKLCKKLKECIMKIINYDEKEMIPLTKEEEKFYKKQEKCHIFEEKFVWINMMKIVKIEKRLKIIVIIQKNLEEPPIPNGI